MREAKRFIYSLLVTDVKLDEDDQDFEAAGETNDLLIVIREVAKLTVEIEEANARARGKGAADD